MSFQFLSFSVGAVGEWWCTVAEEQTAHCLFRSAARQLYLLVSKYDVPMTDRTLHA